MVAWVAAAKQSRFCLRGTRERQPNKFLKSEFTEGPFVARGARGARLPRGMPEPRRGTPQGSSQPSKKSSKNWAQLSALRPVGTP